MKKGILLGMSTLLTVLITSCGQSNTDKPADQSSDKPSQTFKLSSEPVTIKFKVSAAYTQVFQTIVEPVLKQKYPNITLQYIDDSAKLADLVATGDVPDIVGANVDLTPYMQLGLQLDMRDLMKQFNFDVNSIDSNLIKSVQAFAPKGEIYALPSDRNVHDLLYNKDLFDKFSVPYPKDGMSWDEIFNLAKRLTRTDGSTKYYGLNFTWQEMYGELGLHYFDQNGKANVTTPDWQKLANAYLTGFPYRNTQGALRDQFTKDQNTAMVITNSSFLLRNPIPGLNWDFVTPPVFENKLTPPNLGQMMAVPNTSKHKEAAFAVIATYYSTEVQKQVGLTASLVPGGSDPSIAQSYGSQKADPVKQNLMADFNAKPNIKVVEVNSDIADKAMGTAMSELATGKKDVNTALRDAQEAIDKGVQDKGITGK